MIAACKVSTLISVRLPVPLQVSDSKIPCAIPSDRVIVLPMEYRSRSLRLDDEVWVAIQKLPISANQFLRRLLSADGVFESAVDIQSRPRKQTRKEKLLAELAVLDPVGAEREDVELGNFELPRGGSVSQRTNLDAVGPSASSGRGKASTQAFHRTIRQKGDKGR